MQLSFTSVLFRYPGKGGWTFITVPPECAPPFRLSFGRTPVKAMINGKVWETSVWTDKSGKILLPVPEKIRGSLEEGDTASVTLEYLYRINPDSGDKIFKA